MRGKYFWIPLFLVCGFFANLAVAKSSSAWKRNSSDGTAAEKKASPQQRRALGKAEDIQGTIVSVDTAEVTITITSKGVPYVFRVRKTTAIWINGQKSDLGRLKDRLNQNASIRFVPRTEGNFADSIDVTST
jgi:hypothetical protein